MDGPKRSPHAGRATTREGRLQLPVVGCLATVSADVSAPTMTDAERRRPPHGTAAGSVSCLVVRLQGSTTDDEDDEANW